MWKVKARCTQDSRTDRTEKGEVEQENAERKVGQEENVESKDRMWRENTGCRKEK